MSDPETSSAASQRRVLLASLVGTSVEFYDFFIYAVAASLFLGPLFFPSSSPSAQLLASYASFGLAFVARPVGAILFGHFGDRIGRKSTLVASLLLMGGSTTLIAFLPTYGDVGWVATLMLCALRMGQGLGLGGEWGGAALLAVENAPQGWRGRFGMVPQLGAPIGFIAANGVFLVLGTQLGPDEMLRWGWRIPFLASALLVGVGLWVRLKLTETPAFAAALKEAPPEVVPIATVFRGHLHAVLSGTLGGITCFAIFYLTTAFLLGYGTTALSYGRSEFLLAQIGGTVFLALGIALSGALSDRYSPRVVLMLGCAGTLVMAGPLMAPMVESGSVGLSFIYLSIALLCMGLAYGPLGAWLPGLFPARVRYTGASVAFNLGAILGGAIAPFVAQTMAQAGGLTPVGLYLSGCGLISLLGLLIAQRDERVPAPARSSGTI